VFQGIQISKPKKGLGLALLRGGSCLNSEVRGGVGSAPDQQHSDSNMTGPPGSCDSNASQKEYSPICLHTRQPKLKVPIQRFGRDKAAQCSVRQRWGLGTMGVEQAELWLAGSAYSQLKQWDGWAQGAAIRCWRMDMKKNKCMCR
jgi:hypothetical protein